MLCDLYSCSLGCKTTTQRQLLESFDGGPPLREVCVAYADDMRDLYTWLFQQHPALNVPAVPPPYITEGRANWVRS